MTRISLGPASDLPTRQCIAVGDGQAVAFRLGDEVRAYRNRCPHEGQPLAGGWITDGVLTCPAHFWRFDAATGVGLDALATDIVDGEVFVELPAPDERRSIRDVLLDHARTWDRDGG